MLPQVKVLLVILVASLGAQLLKILIYISKQGKLHWHDIFVTGGMPSSHSALVVGLATIIFLTEGLTTNFLISIAIAAIVIRDAMGVRRSVGEEGQLIVRMMKKLGIKTELHYSLGHTPGQVLVGAFFGFFTAVVVNLL